MFLVGKHIFKGQVRDNFIHTPMSMHSYHTKYFFL